jgi:hypothetical protein
VSQLPEHKRQSLLVTKPRVFISSVIAGYEPFRDAAAAGVSAAGGIPVRVEDLPAHDRSPRNACLDLVEGSEIYLVIVGERGGFTAPSGKKVTEEEYQHARRHGRVILAFIQRTDRDPDATRLAADLSDYIGGRFRRTFTGPEELRLEVERALAQVIPNFQTPMTNPAVVDQAVAEASPLLDEVTLRNAVAPERTMELVDVLDLDSKELRDQLFQVGHASSVGFFSYEQAKQTDVRPKSLIITQSNSRRDTADLARLEIRTDGLLTLDTNVTGRRRRRDSPDLTEQLVILERDVKDALERTLRMVNGVYGALDPNGRADRLLLNISLSGIGHRTWMQERVPRGGIPMRMTGPDTLVAFDTSRLVTRIELRESLPFADRVLALLRRQMNHG